MKIIVAEWMPPEGLRELESFAAVEHDPDLWQRRDTLSQKLDSAEALIVRNQTRVDADLIESAASLKAIGRLGVGLDNVDLAAARKHDVPVVYARNANATSVAEYVMAAILTICRDISGASADVKAGGWDRGLFGGMEVHGKTLGLVGLGEISHRVARRSAAFGMRVIAHDPFVAPYDYPVVETGVELVDLDALLAVSDFVSLHVPLDDGTRNLLSMGAFERMKPGAWIINTSRGGVVNEVDLLRALDEGLLGGAVLDVLEEEPPGESSLRKHEKAVLTPHVAGLTQEAQIRTSMLVAREVVKVLRGEPSLCVAN